MIFVTVGTQLSFDRLIKAVDGWAGRNPGRTVFAQTAHSAYVPQHIDATPFLSPQECRQRMQEADAIISHAGMGTIIAALEMGKPLLIMPRRASLGEQRNEHQSSTAKHFGARGVAVAQDEEELAAWLDRLETIQRPSTISAHAPESLLSAIRRFINGEELRLGRADETVGRSGVEAV